MKEKREKTPTKKKKTSTGNPIGRPRAIDDSVLAKLEEGFLYGLTDRECCLYADINPTQLYRYCEEHPDFRERKRTIEGTTED